MSIVLLTNIINASNYTNYDNLLILGDLNSELKGSFLNAFSNVNNLKSLNKEPTCLKNPNNTSCIDFFLTNRSGYVISVDFDKDTALNIAFFLW